MVGGLQMTAGTEASCLSMFSDPVRLLGHATGKAGEQCCAWAPLVQSWKAAAAYFQVEGAAVFL